MEAGLSRSHTLSQARPGFNDVFPTVDEMKQLCKDPVAYVYEHVDGLQSTMLMMSGLVEDFNFAARIKGRDEPLSTQMYLPMPAAHNAGQLFLTAGQQRRANVSNRPTNLSRRAHADDVWAGYCRRRQPARRPD